MGGLLAVFICSFGTMLGLISGAAAASENYLIDCGTNTNSTLKGRKWIGDSSAQNVTFSPQGISASISKVNDNVTYPGLYKTARFFTTLSNYSFKVSAGRYWVRLHFYPFSFRTFNVNYSAFSVNIGSLRLLSNLSVTEEISDLNADLLQGSASGRPKLAHLMKEYSVNIDSGELVITFDPAKINGSFAFVNAIEVVSMPDGLLPSSATEIGSKATKAGSLDLDSAGIQTMYRLNVGGDSFGPDGDSLQSRIWEDDTYYMTTVATGTSIDNRSSISYRYANESYIAPLKVYESARVMANSEVVNMLFNMSWRFTVDSGFAYLVRLHFCELLYNKPNQRVFKIYINNQTAADNFDVFSRAGGKNKAYHSDFLDNLSRGISSLWIQLSPDTATSNSNTDAILNGLEIFKLSSKNNLAGSSRKIN